MTWNWSPALRFSALVLLPLALVLLGFVLLQQILLPFLVGLAAAYLLDPFADRLERLGLSRSLSTTLITGAFFLALSMIVLLLLPPLAAQTAALAGDLPNYVEGLRDRLLPLLTSLVERFSFATDLSAEGLIKDQASQAVGVLMRSVTGLLQSGVALLNLVALIFVTPIVTFYMLRDWDKMIAIIRGLVPPKQQFVFDQLGREVDEVLAGFVRGAGLVCSFLALFYAAGLWLIDLKYGLIIGLLTGFFSFIPFIGMALGGAVGISVAAFQFQDFWMVLAVIGIFALGQFIEGNLISPRLVGSRIRLHPVWMIFSVLAGTALFGIFGTFLAVPVAAVLGVLIRFGVRQYRQSELYASSIRFDDDPSTPEAAALVQNKDSSETARQRTGTLG